MLTITKLRGAEYLLRSVADGVEDYFMGAGEAPGIWQGSWSPSLGVEGTVEADELRALVEGVHPVTGIPLLHGHKPREVKAYDLTFSAPKSVSLLWAFGGPTAAAEVSIAVSSAATTALDFLESHAAVTRRQQDGIRRQVGTSGFAVAAFTHRTSRAGDPQLHIHCLVPNVVEREDGVHVAIDAGPIHTWLKASGTIFQAELQRQLNDRLGVSWGPERNGTRELVGFAPKELRAFSKRTAAIETELEAGPEAVTAKERMRADDAASIKTRDRKDRNLSPEVLRDRWADEAARAGIRTGPGLARTVRHQTSSAPLVERDGLFDALVDPESGVCATRARFTHAHVVERVAALAAGRWDVREIEARCRDFLDSELVVRLAVSKDGSGRRRPPQWTTVEHRRLEDRVLVALDRLRSRTALGIRSDHIAASLDRSTLGDDQRSAVEMLCGSGGSLRVVLAAAGHGKTALTTTAARAAGADGRPVVALATTNRAVGELRDAGLEASTIARWRLDGARLEPGSVVVLDEVSQVSTRDAAAILDAVTTTPGAVLWCFGDEDQGRPVAPGGLAAELARLADAKEIAAAELTVNRRQRHPEERHALAEYRLGRLEVSQATRAANGWEHAALNLGALKEDLASAAVLDIRRHGAPQVVVLAVSHADCEDLADRIRRRLEEVGSIGGPALLGPGWGNDERTYAAGDRVLLHATLRLDGQRLPAGTTGTVTHVRHHGMSLTLDDGRTAQVPRDVVAGHRHDGTPNLSHAWARTIDGAQGGTWDQAHVLATSNLDRHTLYVAQSRGRLPTHTWNAPAPVPAETHGNVVRDERSADEVVLAAATRLPEHRFAAADDPAVLDRRLRAERAEHEAALAAGPPDPRREIARLSDRERRLGDDIRRFAERLASIEPQLSRTGGIRKVRADNRIRHDHLRSERDALEPRLDQATSDLAEVRHGLARMQEPLQERRRWERANEWHYHEIARIDHQLGRHWARVVAGAVEQGEPLAFGRDRLEAAATFLSTFGGNDEPDRDVVRIALREVETAERAIAHQQREVVGRDGGLSL